MSAVAAAPDRRAWDVQCGGEFRRSHRQRRIRRQEAHLARRVTWPWRRELRYFAFEGRAVEPPEISSRGRVKDEEREAFFQAAHIGNAKSRKSRAAAGVFGNHLGAAEPPSTRPAADVSHRRRSFHFSMSAAAAPIRGWR